MGAVGATRNAALEAALVMAAVRDGVPVLRTKDAAHTVDAIAHLHGKLRDGDDGKSALAGCSPPELKWTHAI